MRSRQGRRSRQLRPLVRLVGSLPPRTGSQVRVPGGADARRLAALGTIAIVALLALAVVPGATAAAADPCASLGDDANDSTVLATPPSDEPAGPNDTLAVYNGSELVVHLCQPENGTRSLDASGLAWATVLEDANERVRLRVEAAPNGSLGTLASPDPVPGPALAVVDRSIESELVDGSIPVPSAEHGAALRAAETTYLERERAYERQLRALANATATVENGSVPDGDPIRSTLATRRAYRNASEALRAELYAVADSPVGGPRSATAIATLGERSTALENRTEERLRAHDDALRDREESLARALRLRIVGLGVLGAVLGGVVGAILPTRRGRAARRRLARGEWTTYSRRSVSLPAAVGFLLVCLAGAWLGIEAGGAIVEVLTP